MASALEKQHDLDAKDGSFNEKGDEFGDTNVAVVAADMTALADDVGEALAYARTMSDEDVEKKADYVLDFHGKDPNFPARSLELVQRWKETPNFKNVDPEGWHELKVEMALITINSPYTEVRAVVDNHDDPSEPCLTLRAWIIGLIYVAAGSFINQFFDIRQPGISISSNVAQILAYPAGVFCAKVLPTHVFNTFGYRWSLNPGPFNKKEHMVVTIMANVGFNTPYTANIVWVQVPDRFFGQKWAMDYGYQITTALSTNFIGYGLAGLTRRFLVYPVISVWPANLATIALNRAFHDQDSNKVVEGGWRVSRMRYFTYCFVGMFVYFWFPNFICEAMSYFNWITWIAPNNYKLAAITGSVSGLGFNPLPTFDWNQLLVFTDPLISPFYSTVNSFLGALITFPVIVGVWFSNVYYTSYLPINSNGVFDNTGARYNVSKIVNDEGHFDYDAFLAYSPAYLAAGNILLYSFFFAVYTATIVHAFLFHHSRLSMVSAPSSGGSLLSRILRIST